MVWLTVIAALFIAAPMGIWLVGAGPAVMVMVNASALILTIRLLVVAANIADNRQQLATMGLLAGAMGGLTTELLLHVGDTQNLATAFAAYATFGAELYRLDVVSRWWPFAFVGLSGLFYSGLALLIGHLVQYRRHILGLDARRHS